MEKINQDTLIFIDSYLSDLERADACTNLIAQIRLACPEYKIALLNKYPDASIVIEGYASSDGSEGYNMKLSERRATSVKEYLVENGIDANRLNTVGYGETKLTGDNNTISGRKQSRRAKINRTAKMSIN